MALIGVAIAVVAALFWLSSSEKADRIELNVADLCPKDSRRSPPAVYVVLVDQTDPLEQLARTAVANEVLSRLRAELEEASDTPSNRHARVEVWTFTAGNAVSPDTYRVANVPLSLSQALSMCNPGAPAKWDHLYRNVDVVRRQHDRFYQSLRQIIDQSLTFKEAPRSPIIEALYGIGAKVFSAPEWGDSSKRLILISDLVQGTQTADFFRPGYKPDFKSWRSTIAGRQTLPDLAKVGVTAIVIPGSRPDLQNNSLIGFWTDFLDATGAKIMALKKL
ncbi:MAG: hypothetical protein KIT25_03820 [Enhydrobacter sp.]|nr:MAG: hypothetical protein KIT25_03820 [Enhydrobacter sp.]